MSMPIEEWDAFIASVTSRPLLTEKREAELAAVMKGGGEAGRKAKVDLLESNLRSVVSIAVRYAEPGHAYTDLIIPAGNMGLVRALETFDGWGEKSLSTYTAACVEQEILKYKRDPEGYATWCREQGVLWGVDSSEWIRHHHSRSGDVRQTNED